MPATGEGKVARGAELRDTYGVMMRERAELVRGVQAGEVSGVGLWHKRNSQSAGALRDTQQTQGTHYTGPGHHHPSPLSRLHICPSAAQSLLHFPLRALGWTECLAFLAEPCFRLLGTYHECEYACVRARAHTLILSLTLSLHLPSEKQGQWLLFSGEL